MARFIPQYCASTPQEQGRLEEKFLEFANHATLISRVDYKVYVSEDKDKNIHLCIEKPTHYVMDMNIGIDSRGKDGKTAIAMKRKTNFERYLEDQLKDKAFADRFQNAGEEWGKILKDSPDKDLRKSGGIDDP